MPEKIPTIGNNKQSEPTPDKSRLIKHEEIAELEGPIKHIIEQMGNNIERGEYDLVIGIDASGRIPTLIMVKIINHIYNQNGYDSPKVRFVAGSGGKNVVNELVKKWNPQKKVLVIEDTLITGYSLKFLIEGLQENGIRFDIITVSGPDNSRMVSKFGFYKIGADNIYVGDSVGDATIYGRRNLSGIQKEVGDTFSRPYKKVKAEEQITKLGEEVVDPFGGSVSSYAQEQINEARTDADVVADHLINWYESQKQENEK